MQFTLLYSAEANETLDRLELEDQKKCAKVHKTLALMQTNLRHQGLCTHKNDARKGPNDEEVFEAYRADGLSNWSQFTSSGSQTERESRSSA